MRKAQLFHVLHKASLWLFWPGLALVTWGELAPQEPDPRVFFFLYIIPWDKAQHFTAYFGLAAMATMVLGPRPRLAWAIPGLIAYGGLMEIIQGLTGRDASWWDLLANSIGVASGLGVALLAWRQSGNLLGRAEKH